MICHERLLTLLHFNSKSGIFSWKERPIEEFKAGKFRTVESKQIEWNKRYANKVVGAPNNKGYLVIWLDDKSYLAHRLAWFYETGEWPNQIDHINGIKTDNTFSNLRNVTAQQNSKNLKLPKHNTTGFKGVSWHKKARKWIVSLTVNGEYKYLGLFDSFGDARLVYQEAAKEAGFTERHIHA